MKSMLPLGRLTPACRSTWSRHVQSSTALVLCLLAVGLAGCPPRRLPPGGAPPPPAAASVVSGGLSVGIVVPTRHLAAGDEFEVRLVARNVSGAPIRIKAPSSTPIIVKLWRHTGVGWEEVKRYPRTDMMVMKIWTLAPGRERAFALRLRVEPDWPTGELLRITGELNGRPDAVPGVTLDVAG